MPGKAGMQRRRSTEKTDRHQIWMAMRILRGFTAPAICTASGARMDNAWTYMRRLAVHGFIRQEGGAVLGRPGEFKRFRLVRDIGPDHPVFCDVCGQSITAKTCKEATND